MALRGYPISLWALGSLVAAFCILGIYAPTIDYDPAGQTDDIRGRALCAPAFAEPSEMVEKFYCKKGSDSYWGTDFRGREIGMRLVKSVEAVFKPGLVASFIAVVFGGLAGAIAGYFGGPIRLIVSYVNDTLASLPRLVFLVLFCTIFKPDIMKIGVITGILTIPTVARLVQRRVESLAADDYILAHIAHGFSRVKILLYHILWLQCRPIMVRQASYVFGYIIFIEAALAYLGDYGVQEPSPSWGNMIARVKKDYLFSVWPWLLPALAAMITIAVFMGFGNLLAQHEEEDKR